MRVSGVEGKRLKSTYHQTVAHPIPEPYIHSSQVSCTGPPDPRMDVIVFPGPWDTVNAVGSPVQGPAGGMA